MKHPMARQLRPRKSKPAYHDLLTDADFDDGPSEQGAGAARQLRSDIDAFYDNASQ